MRKDIKEALMKLYEELHKRRATILTLSAIVVFVTTYLLILPALTLEKDKAADQGGTDVPEVTYVSEDSPTDNEESADPADTGQDDPSPEGDAVVDGDSDNAGADGDQQTIEAEIMEVEEKAASADPLKYEGEGYTVTVSDPASVLPEGTQIIVEEINSDKDALEYKNYYDDALKAVQDVKDGRSVTDLRFAKFYNITLVADGKEIKPDDNVSVSIEYGSELGDGLKADRKSRVRIIHFNEDSKTGETTAEVLENKAVDVTTDSNDRLKETVFEADHFSVYAVVYTAEYEYMTADGKTYKFTVGFDDEAGIPEGAELKVNEIEKGSDDYNKYLDNAAKELGAEDTGTLSFARFFDIEFTKDGEKIEPKTPVQVTLEYDDELHLTDGGDLKVVHFADKGTEIISDVGLSRNSKELSWVQDSFSVTGTIVNNPHAGSGHRYAVLVRDTQANEYYAVGVDGSLIPVTYNSGNNTVNMPFVDLWTYTSAHDKIAPDGIGSEEDRWANNPPNNLRIDIDCRRYNWAQLPEGHVYRYISPASDDGIDSENRESNHATFKGNNLIVYENHTLHSVAWDNQNTNQYIGADFENMHITGNQTSANAAEVYFAQITEVPVGANRETVSHIDIGIVGEGILDVPLAYGKYYYDSEQRTEAAFGEVTRDNNVTLHLEQDVDVTHEDIMNASIHAYDKNGNELDDAFYITGFTANEHTDHSAVQVRMEGSFKVSTLPEYTNGNSNEDAARRHARLDNQVYYRISTSKEITFKLEYVDSDGVKHQLYDASGNELSVTTVCTLSAGFSYWDENNECPPVLEDFEQKYHLGDPVTPPDGHNSKWWKDGAIIDNTHTGNLPNEPGGQDGHYGLPGDSGMDFVIGSRDSSDANIVAVEIVKMIVDEDGNRIKPAENVTNKCTID